MENTFLILQMLWRSWFGFKERRHQNRGCINIKNWMIQNSSSLFLILPTLIKCGNAYNKSYPHQSSQTKGHTATTLLSLIVKAIPSQAQIRLNLCRGEKVFLST